MRHAARLAGSILLLLTPAAALAQSGEGALHASLFADFNYQESQRPIAQGFRLGQVAGHLTWGMSDRTTLFTEATATSQSTGLALEFERVLLRYDARDWLKLSAGRGHTPISYWYTSFHHGQWFQSTIARPEMVRGGSPLIPMHFVGVFAEGNVPAGPLVLGYSTGLGNGRGTSIMRGGDAGDANNSRATVLGATVRAPSLAGARIGGAIYNDRLTPSAGIDVRERMLSGHFALERETPELIVEYTAIRHDPSLPVAQAPTTTTAYYAQLAYRLSGRASAWKPYVRFDEVRVPAGDTVFAPLRLSYAGYTTGVRYDVAPTIGLKLEYRGERVEHGPRMRTIAASIAFTMSGHTGHHDADPVITDDGNDGHDGTAAHEGHERHEGHEEGHEGHEGHDTAPSGASHH
ncbi:hypothetical protein J421_0924 [Gemmatirosa kalamazoonensis]|uniref:Phosphate-selective porin O and P n=1 Tax=Gemmatirosa kalamazoonensis TaxID=861299 RepID=W0RCE1_9BACT|nr:hypothetical protein [Gemmatirosa kalamazoonensis]AHG88461.1 hypothetical protein J421_0924 [Gemmatirosa kalamazoonensis]